LIDFNEEPSYNKVMKVFPILNYKQPLPEGNHPGAFGVNRKHDVHTGVDIYCPEDSIVSSIEDGTIIKSIIFTGDKAGSPWWEETYSLIVEGPSGWVLYGELDPQSLTPVGTKVKTGDPIGKIKRVLKKDKGKPTTMLHFELYNKNPDDAAIWQLGSIKPDELQDPTILLKNILERKI
jgi:murein DD-endopeptidase MepM/ murein hydrolase activator NlpD